MKSHSCSLEETPALKFIFVPTVASLRQNQFGGTFSGPVFLPRFGEGTPPFYNRRDRTFFFFSYEGLRLRQPQVAETTVPTLSARQQANSFIRPLLEAFPLPNGAETGNNLARISASYSNPTTFDASTTPRATA